MTVLHEDRDTNLSPGDPLTSYIPVLPFGSTFYGNTFGWDEDFVAIKVSKDGLLGVKVPPIVFTLTAKGVAQFTAEWSIVTGDYISGKTYANTFEGSNLFGDIYQVGGLQYRF